MGPHLVNFKMHGSTIKITILYKFEFVFFFNLKYLGLFWKGMIKPGQGVSGPAKWKRDGVTVQRVTHASLPHL
jgi:hypothetical protein